MMAELLYNAYFMATFGNIFLLLVLLYLFIQDYRKVKSKFTLGLVLFASMLLLNAIVSCPVTSIFYKGSLCCVDVTLHVWAAILEFIGLVVFTYLIIK